MKPIRICLLIGVLLSRLHAQDDHPGFRNSRSEGREQAYRDGLHLHRASNLEVPVCTMPVNRFDNLVTSDHASSGRCWYGNYSVDKTVGVDDGFSIRFDGPQAAYGFFGKDHGFDPLDGPRLAIEFMIKAKNVTGDGLHVSIGQGRERWAWDRHFAVPVVGDSAWQPVRIVFEPGEGRHALMLVLKLNATGTVWVDNLSIRSLPEDSPVKTRPVAVRQVLLPCDRVLDLHCDEGKADAVLDRSGWGNGGLLVGPEWVRDEGRWVLRFDGQDDYVMVPHANSLNPRDGATLEVWCKPDVEIGHGCRLVAKYSDQILGLSGDSVPYCAVGLFRATSPGKTSGTPDIAAGRWYHVAQTFDGRKVRLFVNGRLQSETPLAGGIRASLYPLFVGTYLPHEGNAWFKGTIGGVRMHWRALTTSEIARIAEDDNPELMR